MAFTASAHARDGGSGGSPFAKASGVRPCCCCCCCCCSICCNCCCCVCKRGCVRSACGCCCLCLDAEGLFLERCWSAFNWGGMKSGGMVERCLGLESSVSACACVHVYFCASVCLCVCVCADMHKLMVQTITQEVMQAMEATHRFQKQARVPSAQHVRSVSFTLITYIVSCTQITHAHADTHAHLMLSQCVVSSSLQVTHISQQLTSHLHTAVVALVISM